MQVLTFERLTNNSKVYSKFKKIGYSHLKNYSLSHVNNSSCQKNFPPYICSDLVPGLITGIKREVSQNLTLSP